MDLAGLTLGLQLNRFKYAGGDAAIASGVATVARRAEAAGLTSLWVMDHFFQIPSNGPAEDPLLEAYSTLTYVAGLTERIKLGTMVTGVTYRKPGVLIKTVTTLDVLSGGRAYFGIGAGWFEREHAGLGVPFPPVKERFERLEETLRIAHQMWSGDVAPFDGEHFQLAETLCQPMPLSRPHPTILVGGGGEQKTLRFVARYGDACNLFSADLETVRHKLEVLRGHCEAEGRRYSAIEKTTLGRIPGLTQADGVVSYDRTEAADFFARLGELGVDQHLTSFVDPTHPSVGDALAGLVELASGVQVAERP
jgi:F420-dependent oxidoreductase-like protein